MRTYLVGGAVRDQLLGKEPKERDWVVVGSSPDEMIAKGFKQVGKDFPVFIHPKSGEEYALARTERKSGHGYTGFNFDTNSNVSLEEDLERRDLTINAIAQDDSGNLIDPFGGQKDILEKKLRHVSDAFSEDPLRVLRIARFKSDLDNFEITKETLIKINDIKESGELNYLTGERIWLELYKVSDPFKFMMNIERLDVDNIFPGFIKGTSCTNKNLTKLYNLSFFLHSAIKYIDVFCKKLKVPNEYRDLALLWLKNSFNVLCLLSLAALVGSTPTVIAPFSAKTSRRLPSLQPISNTFLPEISFFFDETINEIKRLAELFSSQKVQNDTIIK